MKSIFLILLLQSAAVLAAEKPQMIQHPLSEKGLTRINADGSYIYEYKKKPKSESMSIRFGTITPPTISSKVNGLTYEDYYGAGTPFGVFFDYETLPLQKFGKLGLQFGSGIFTDTANGRFRNSGAEAEEKYNLYIIPISLFAVYRMEYSRNQWVVPYINGGLTYYALAEMRDDGKRNNYVGSPAVGGGGGVHVSISQLAGDGGFALADEYGVSDLWLTLEVRVMAGLKKDLDMSNQSFNAGITVDY